MEIINRVRQYLEALKPKAKLTGKTFSSSFAAILALLGFNGAALIFLILGGYLNKEEIKQIIEQLKK